MDTRIPKELVDHLKSATTIEDLVVEGLNSVYADMMKLCVEKNINFDEFVAQVTAAARLYAEECNQ